MWNSRVVKRTMKIEESKQQLHSIIFFFEMFMNRTLDVVKGVTVQKTVNACAVFEVATWCGDFQANRRNQLNLVPPCFRMAFAQQLTENNGIHSQQPVQHHIHSSICWYIPFTYIQQEHKSNQHSELNLHFHSMCSNIIIAPNKLAAACVVAVREIWRG